MDKEQIFNIAGKEVEVSTGEMAMLSQGAVMLKMGGTVLFATATVDKNDTDLDYFPLSVEYIEKMYARGAISGSRFKKREGRPSEEAVIKAREVDHSIRSLFPKSWKRPVSVVLTVLAYDGENDPQSLTVLGASLAIMQSGVPFAGPCASVIVGIDNDNNIHLNPPVEGREELKGEFIISAVNGGKILSLEGWGKEVLEETMDLALDKSVEEINSINSQQDEFINKVGKTLEINAEEYSNKPADDEILEYVNKNGGSEITEIMSKEKSETYSRGDHLRTLAKELFEKYSEENEAHDYKSDDFTSAAEYIARKKLREGVLKEDKRVSGRALDEIRPLDAKIDILPTVHGSALFTRGLTQSLSIVTLGPKSDELIIDDMEGETTKAFMHEYNFPPFSTGEAGRYSYYPGRREIGHGAIGENALKHIIASEEDFPYTIRTVSEIMTSNGSTSMAATCASSMALMAAGVPTKSPVAGIGVGLVTEDENEDNYKLLLDIEGIEDFYGDMDFKICGTKDGITAIQYENKLQGVKISILKEAFRLAQKGRMQVLEVMNSAISESRKEVPANAPKVETIRIEADQIGELIGPGGKNIKDIIEKANELGKADVDIDIQDEGIVNIAAVNKEQMDYVIDRITSLFAKPIIGEVYECVVDKIMDFGAFLNVKNSSITGLCHVSELSDDFVKDVKKVVQVGQEVKAKILKIDDQGRINFTMKGVDQK